MKWNEMSVFQKTVSIVACLCVIVYFALSILELTSILSDTHDAARIFLNIAWLSGGVLYWKTQRNFAVFMYILGGSGLLLSIIYFLV